MSRLEDEKRAAEKVKSDLTETKTKLEAEEKRAKEAGSELLKYKDAAEVSIDPITKPYPHMYR